MLADIIPGISTADATVIAELGLFVVTAFLAIFTWKNVRQTTKLIEAQLNPFVVVRAEWGTRDPMIPPSMFIFIKNMGGGVARDIHFVEVSDDFAVPKARLATDDRDTATTFKKIPLIENGIKELTPNQEMGLARLNSADVFAIKMPVEIAFEYENIPGESKSGSNILDFPSYADSLLRA